MKERLVFTVFSVFFFLASVELYAAPLGGGNDSGFLSRLATNSSVILKIRNFERSISKLDSSVEGLDTKALIDGLLRFDRNGIKRRAGLGSDSLVDVLGDSPAYFVVSKQGGDGSFDFALILSPTLEVDRDGIDFVSDVFDFFINLAESQRAGRGRVVSDFVSQIRQKIDAIECVVLTDSLIFATSQEFSRLVRDSIDNSDTPKISRNFRSAERYINGKEDFILFWNYQESRHLLVPLGFATDNSWKVESPAFPWSVQTCEIIEDDRLFIDFTFVDAATVPLSGAKKMNLFWNSISNYPSMPDGAISYYVESINHKLMSNFVMNESDAIYGEAVRERFSDPLRAFEIGLGQEELGNTTAQIYFGPEHFDKLTLLSLELEENKSSRDYFAMYLTAFADRDAKKRGVESEYEMSEHRGLDILWAGNFDDKRGQMLREQNWFYSQEFGKPRGEMPADFALDIKRRKVDLGNHQGFLIDNVNGYADVVDSENFKGLDSGKGVVFEEDWAIFGNWFQVNSVVDWGSDQPKIMSSDKLRINGSSEIFDRETSAASRADFHHFSVVRDSGNKETILFFRDLVLKPLVRKGLLDSRKEFSEEDLELLSDHQKLRWQVCEVSDSVSSLKPIRVESRWLNEDRTRHFSRISWQFRKR